MTVNPSIDPARLLEEQLAQASPDLLRELLTVFVNTLMSAEADAVCGAAYGQASPERTNRRNGYRHRDFDTRAGTLDVAVPKLRTCSYFPEWLLERRKRAERALTSVVATCYLLGVSTRRMDKLVASLGITTLSKSQVSEMAKELDAHVEARKVCDDEERLFVEGGLDAGHDDLAGLDAALDQRPPDGGADRGVTARTQRTAAGSVTDWQQPEMERRLLKGHPWSG